MSKDDFPPSITAETLLNATFEFIEDWKTKLYDMLSFNTSSVPTALIKQEPIDEVRNIFTILTLILQL